VHFDEVLAGDEFVWVADVELLFVVVLITRIQIRLIKVRRHLTPHLNTLHVRQVSLLLQVQPIGFVQFRSDEEVEVVDAVVFADEGGGEAEHAVAFEFGGDGAEDLGWDYLYFVEDY